MFIEKESSDHVIEENKPWLGFLKKQLTNRKKAKYILGVTLNSMSLKFKEVDPNDIIWLTNHVYRLIRKPPLIIPKLNKNEF